jgi:hypothetical protein
LSSRLLSKNVKIEVHKTIILTVVLYECETWTLALREEHRQVFENKVLRRIFGPKRAGKIGGWRKLHDEELHNLYPSPNVIKDEMGRASSTHGEMRTAYRVSLESQNERDG